VFDRVTPISPTANELGQRSAADAEVLESEFRALRQSRLRVEGAIEASGLILREWDTSTDESVYCGAMESILGIFPHELTGSFEKWISLIHPDDRADYRREVQRVLTEGGPFEIEYRARKRSDKHTLLFERGYFISPAQGASPVMSSMISDVSDLRELESRVRKSQRVEAFGQLTGGVAHDFNNMLSVVIGYAQILMEEPCDNPEQISFLREIEKAALRASSLTNQLLAFSKPPAVRKGTLQLGEMLQELSKMLRRLLGERIVLRMEPGEALWPVQADRSQIEQVFINIAVACREAMGDGGEVLLATRNETLEEALKSGDRVLPAGGYVLAAISLLPAPGKRHAKTLEKNRSLTTAKSILEQNEGHLATGLSSKGTLAIDIRFPGVMAEKTDDTASVTPKRTSKAAEILLVEDDSAMRQFTKAVLSRLGHHVVEAADGEAALRLFDIDRSYEPDLLVADMVMPRLGGLELAGMVSKKLPETAVLLISGYPDQQPIAQANGYAFLKKPFAVGELITRVGSLLGD
jgi:two-component system, cell cycle sensor histidine kinase and response regulator CckA